MTLLAQLSPVFAVFGMPGILELIIIGVVLLILVAVPIVVVSLVVGASRRTKPPHAQYGEAPSPNLMACPDCGHGVSHRAESCPNCGAPVAGKGPV